MTQAITQVDITKHELDILLYLLEFMLEMEDVTDGNFHCSAKDVADLAKKLMKTEDIADVIIAKNVCVAHKQPNCLCEDSRFTQLEWD